MKFKVGQRVVFNYDYISKKYGINNNIIKKYSKRPLTIAAFNSKDIILTPNPFNTHKKYWSFPLGDMQNAFKLCNIYLNEELFKL